MRVLVSAYACEPDRGSEPGVGWHWSRQLARRHDVTVLTRTNNRAAIESAVRAQPGPHPRFEFVDLPAWARWWKRGQRGIYLYYWLWQRAALRAARRLHAARPFDVAHALTFGNLWLPASVARLPVPFIWGPLGGAERVPPSLRADLPLRGRAQERLRDLVLGWTLDFSPSFRRTAGRARLILARTPLTEAALAKRYRPVVEPLLETAVDEALLATGADGDGAGREPKLVVMAGRLLHWKGMHLGLDAFARVRAQHPDARLEIIGDGPCGDALRRRCRAPDLESGVLFTGALPRAALLQRFRRASVFLQPSLKDAGAWVMFEAMACGLPSVYLDHAGPAEIADASCGIAVPIGDRDTVVRGLADGVGALLDAPSRARALGTGAQARLHRDWTWQVRGERMLALYERLCPAEQTGC